MNRNETTDAISILLAARVACANRRDTWRTLNNAAVALGALSEYSLSEHCLVAQADEYGPHFVIARSYGYPTIW